MTQRRNPTIGPEDATALWREQAPVRRATVTAKCQLITPMYGGGVEPGKVDRTMPIRASALRGQLRFWWRVLFGGGRKATAVFQDECALWGGISAEGPQASQVAVRVDCEPVSDSQLIDAKPPHVPDYGLILNPKEPPPMLLAQGYEFEVTLAFQNDEKQGQVVEALRWWASFGGMGARTRRGFGAVKMDCAGVEPVQREDIQRLGGRMVAGPLPSRDALAAWRWAIQPLRRFRQEPGIGRGKGGGNRPGRSYWPEADAIRRVVGGKSAHEPQHLAGGVFPRAAFGLPIVFHFKDRDDPRDHTLVADQGDRMASPLILRPYFDGIAYRSMALLLPGWEQRIGVPVVLERKARRTGKPTSAWPDDGAERERVASQIMPMKGRGEDALSAFMRYFEEQQRRPEGRRRRGSR